MQWNHCGWFSTAEEYLQATNNPMTYNELMLSLTNPVGIHKEFWVILVRLNAFECVFLIFWHLYVLLFFFVLIFKILLNGSLFYFHGFIFKFWCFFQEIPMNHPDRIEVPGSGVKNRYRTILPSKLKFVELCYTLYYRLFVLESVWLKITCRIAIHANFQLILWLLAKVEKSFGSVLSNNYSLSFLLALECALTNVQESSVTYITSTSLVTWSFSHEFWALSIDTIVY